MGLDIFWKEISVKLILYLGKSYSLLRLVKLTNLAIVSYLMHLDIIFLRKRFTRTRTN